MNAAIRFPLLILFATIAMAFVPAAEGEVTFDFNRNRVSSIRVNGAELLTGGGIYLIGSKTGKDDPASNYSSVGSNGSQMTNGGPPFKLTFTRKSATILGFKAELGPLANDVKTLSMPFDFAKEQATRFSFNGTRYFLNNSSTPTSYQSGSFVQYTSIPQPFPIESGGVILGYAGVAQTKTQTTPGTVDGPAATIRVNILGSSRYRSMGFTNHFGTHNLELAFGSLTKGQTAMVEGELVVTVKESPTSWTFEAESQLSHQIGRRDSNGWSVRVGDTVGRFMTYGPYTTAITAGSRKATFRLMLDNTTADNNRILTIDVYDAASNRVLASRSISRREFTAGPMTYQGFPLDFTARAGQRLEFRAYWHGGSYVRQDYVRVR